MKKELLFLLVVMLSISTQGQQTDQTKFLEGFWEGAFIKGNSYQKIDLQLYQREANWYALQIMDEWHPSFGEFEVPVEQDSLGVLRFPTGYGKVTLSPDTNNLELVGSIANELPAIYLHLKKVADPPLPNYTASEVSIPSGDINLYGYVHQPLNSSAKTAIILVGGRGCYADQTKYNLYAKFLQRYGITVLAYQKRGTGQSGGECATATIDDLANDVIAAKNFLAQQGSFKHVGVLGISAGGWTMTKAEEDTEFDFMISVVGPGTSVKEQQLQSMRYGAEFYKLSEKGIRQAEEYTQLMLSAKSTTKTFNQMQTLLADAEKEDWKKLLDDTDIPEDAQAIDELWVRRHAYDPAKVLRDFDRPFLAIYGERDWIVPATENTAALTRFFENRPDRLAVIVAHGAEHGMEMEAKYISLNPNTTYWHFYRISPQVRIAIVDFLRTHAFIPNN